MLPSLHSEFVFVGIEPEEDFAEALALDAERERNGAPQGFPPLSYRSAIRYSEQLRRYLAAFGRERVHIIFFDDFRSDTIGTYRTTCEFLGVDSSVVPSLEVVNPNKRARSSLVRRLVRTPPEGLRPLVHAVTPQDLRRRRGGSTSSTPARCLGRQPALPRPNPSARRSRGRSRSYAN